ncbi:N-acetylneuraminate lyase [Anaerotruncus sp. DFI.9.16]|uniref:N-acetylneuraminate lyase n=1 Tax=Anaerotruncus sp. DFI.9.16 TaxID=2965275 RepID=UPI00210E8835|nr:N-acetylneuraminate lyase [Anaerotruncus sp. DFI.9.16]
MKQFEGIYPAIITPIDEDEEINEKALAQVIEKTIGQGVSGFYVSGSTGESFLLRDEQRVQLIKAVCAIVDGRCDVIANIGTFSTRASIKMANAAAECGVAAISAVPPFYFSYSRREIVQYYFDIAEASGMPVILYNIPQMSGVSFGTEELVELLAHDGIVGVKQTTMDLMQTEALVRICRDKAVFNGHDEILLPALSVGIRASIGSTFSIMADVFVQLKKAFDAGDMERARYLQGKGNGMIRTLLEIGIFPAIKGVLKLQGIDCGNCIKPFQPLRPEDYQKLEKALVDLYDGGIA